MIDGIILIAFRAKLKRITRLIKLKTVKKQANREKTAMWHLCTNEREIQDVKHVITGKKTIQNLKIKIFKAFLRFIWAYFADAAVWLLKAQLFVHQSTLKLLC